MKKSELKQGAILQARNDYIYILIGGRFVNLKNGGYMEPANYDENLMLLEKHRTNKFDGFDEFDIMKVFNPTFENEGYYDYLQNCIKWTWIRDETREQLAKLQAENEQLKKELEALKKSKITNELQVGDNVVIIEGKYKGYNGKIVEIDGEDDEMCYLVYMGEEFNGYNGGHGNCQQNNDRWFDREKLKKVN